METTYAVITIAELLMFLSSGSGNPKPSLAPFHRSAHLWLHTGPLVHNPQCYFNTVSDPLPMVQLSPCDHLVYVAHEGYYHCVGLGSRAVSNKLHWRKKRSLEHDGIFLPEQLDWTPNDTTDTLDSDGQKQISGKVKKDVAHCGARNLTGNKMLLTEKNTTCPAQREKNEHGLEHYWPEINLGSTHVNKSNNQCVQAARTCSWSQEQGLHLIPSDRFTQCPITNINITWAAHELRNISHKDNISSEDIAAAARVVDEALQVNYSVLSTAGEEVSSVTRELDAILTRVRLSPGESVKNVRPKVAIYVLNVEKKPPFAVVLESSSSSEDLEGGVLRTINSQEEIRSPMVDVAVLLPQALMTSTSHVALAIFSDESAFQDPRYKANSRIVSLNMVNASKLQGEQYVDIMFRPRIEMGGKTCAFWDFTLHGGAWSTKGCQLIASGDNTHDVCRCSHLTHFAEIISQPDTLDPMDQDILSIISIIGCSLSFVGLLAIFITGAAFRQWRAQLGNKILLHLSTAVFINMLVFLITATELLQTGVPCIILGAMLHYSVLASFCWMLVSALLQFKRLVIIFGSQYIPHLLLKASLFAWGVPLLPVTVLLAVDVNNYTPEGRSFCYPDGLGFYLAVLCPVLMIVMTNLLIYGMILYNVIRSSAIKSNRQTGRKLVMQSIATSMLLFFLLGLTWVFGLVAHLSKLFAYLFCITATLQGFILFIFFVLGKKESRFYWTKNSTEPNFITSTTSTPAERGPLRWRDDTSVL